MPGENIHDWSVTAANNSNADSSINWAEGQPRASVNNSSRSMMAAHAKNRNLQNGSIVTGGTADAQTFTSGVGYTVIPTGLRVLLKIGPTLTNNGPATLEMDGLGAVAIKDQHGVDIATGAIVAETRAEFIYSGTNWVLLTPITAPTPPVGDRDSSIANTAWVGGEVPAILAARAMFRANMAVGMSGFGASIPATIIFGTEQIDIGGFYNGSSVWTPPAGRVLLMTSLFLSADLSGAIVSAEFWKNGAATSQRGVTIVGTNVAIGGIDVTAVDVADGISTYSIAVTFDRPGGGIYSGSFSGMLM